MLHCNIFKTLRRTKEDPAMFSGKIRIRIQSGTHKYPKRAPHWGLRVPRLQVIPPNPPKVGYNSQTRKNACLIESRARTAKPVQNNNKKNERQRKNKIEKGIRCNLRRRSARTRATIRHSRESPSWTKTITSWPTTADLSGSGDR